MYEHMTFETILKQMLDRVPNILDKREGSVIYNALAPAAVELAQKYIELDTFLDLVFVTTSSGEYLDRRAAELGLTRHPATKAKRLGLFFDSDNNPMDVPLESRFSLELLNYVVLEKLETGRFVLECETPGETGNKDFGNLIPIETIPDLGVAELADVLSPGEEEESDESLRERYLLKAQAPATSGNPAHYVIWAREVPGVGDANVIPVWNGPGTVKVVLIDPDKRAVSEFVRQAVEDHIETQRPIGADVTVVPATEVEINISVGVELPMGVDIDEVRTVFRDAVTEYLKGLAFKDKFVRPVRIGNILLDVAPIIDYENLAINGQTSNIELADDEVAVLGTIQLEVI